MKRYVYYYSDSYDIRQKEFDSIEDIINQAAEDMQKSVGYPLRIFDNKQQAFIMEKYELQTNAVLKFKDPM